MPLFSLPDPVPLRMSLSGCPSPGALLGVPLPVFLPVSISSFTEIHTASRRESVVGMSVEPLKHDSALCGTRPRVGKRTELRYRYPRRHLPRFPFLTFLRSGPIHQSDTSCAPDRFTSQILLAIWTDSLVRSSCTSDRFTSQILLSVPRSSLVALLSVTFSRCSFFPIFLFRCLSPALQKSILPAGGKAQWDCL